MTTPAPCKVCDETRLLYAVTCPCGNDLFDVCVPCADTLQRREDDGDPWLCRSCKRREEAA